MPTGALLGRWRANSARSLSIRFGRARPYPREGQIMANPTKPHFPCTLYRDGLSRAQIKKLVAKLDRARVHQRMIDGKTIDYLEGGFVVSEANAIFGLDGWDRETLHMEKVFEQTRFQETHCAYTARVRVR